MNRESSEEICITLHMSLKILKESKNNLAIHFVKNDTLKI